jgi:hypothetical protein
MIASPRPSSAKVSDPILNSLVGREASADARLKRDLVQLHTGRPGVSARGSGDHAEQRADRQRRALGQPRPER